MATDILNKEHFISPTELSEMQVLDGEKISNRDFTPEELKMAQEQLEEDVKRKDRKSPYEMSKQELISANENIKPSQKKSKKVTGKPQPTEEEVRELNKQKLGPLADLQGEAVILEVFKDRLKDEKIAEPPPAKPDLYSIARLENGNAIITGAFKSEEEATKYLRDLTNLAVEWEAKAYQDKLEADLTSRVGGARLYENLKSAKAVLESSIVVKKK